MPIQRTIDTTTTNCSRYNWDVIDKKHLADLVARLTLGQHLHVSNILHELNPTEWAKSPKDAAVEQILKWLNGNIYNRDGWLFQMISWVSLAKSEPDALLDIPHTQPAQKGFDGLCLLASEDGQQIHAIVYTEDKATDDPRPTVQGDVYSGIDEIVKGSREPELVSKISTLLQRKHGNSKEVNLLIQSVLSTAKPVFRIAVTTSISKLPSNIKLFDGMELHAAGSTEQRFGETLIHEDMREWMNEFAQLVKTSLDELKEVPNVR